MWFHFFGVKVPPPPPVIEHNKLPVKEYRKRSYKDALKTKVVGLDVINTIHDRTVHIVWPMRDDMKKSDWWKEQYLLQKMKVV